MRATKQIKVILKQKLVFYIDEECISNLGIRNIWLKSYDLYNYLKRRLVEYRALEEDEKGSLLQYVLMSASNQTISEMRYNEARIDCYGSIPHLWIRGKVNSPLGGCPRESFYIKCGKYSMITKYYKKFILSDGFLLLEKIDDGNVYITLNGDISPYTERISEEEEFKMYTGRIMNHTQKYHNSFSIKDIKFNGPATIVFWEDGEKTVVKMDKSEKEFDVEKALMAAYTKRALSTLSNAKERSIDLTLDMAREKYDAYLNEIKPKEVRIKK